MTQAQTKEPETATAIFKRLDTLLDVEWRILDLAQYHLLSDITAEKNELQKQLQIRLRNERVVDTVRTPDVEIAEMQMIRDLQAKLHRNNVRLMAKRDACLQRLRAGWMATQPESSIGYDRDGDLVNSFSQMILNLKL
ncbi:MAG: hypothetical protein ABID63_13835 [Pseudomonadota bacterium]